jgi:two-component system cell cycle response regulator DivK
MATALIIDDNSMNLETLRVLLAREGFDSIALMSPANLSAHLDPDEQIAVVFLDLEFPNHDGLSLVQDLRAMPQLANVPIIAYTVHISEQNEARTAGFDGFIGKPLSARKFPEQLQRILAGQSIWDTGQ